MHLQKRERGQRKATVSVFWQTSTPFSVFIRYSRRFSFFKALGKRSKEEVRSQSNYLDKIGYGCSAVGDCEVNPIPLLTIHRKKITHGLLLLFMLVLRQRLLAGLVAFTGIANSRKFGPSFSMSTQHAPSGEQGPVHCERYLTYDYKPVGNEMKLKDSTQFYGVGSPRTKQGIILIPDTWGWNAGRIRNIADFLATNDIYCAIPQLMGSSTEANSGPSLSEASSFGDYMKSATFDCEFSF